jgi:SAM-dependent methyltransferase
MQFNRLFFWFFYRFRTPPWEGHPLPQRLAELVAGSSPLRPGKALDAGCGTGDAAIYLGRHGWQVTAFDFVHIALDKARVKAAAAGVSIRFFQADVTRVNAASVGEGFQLIVDNGLLHGLTDEGRDAYARLMSASAAKHATLLIAAFGSGERRGPRGIDGAEVERRLGADWALVGQSQDPAMSRRPGDPIYVYELRRR